MQCMSCNFEINPQWTHAIEMNACPFCGKNIIEEKLQSLLINLKDVFEQLKEYPTQLKDWLLSNYDFIHTSDENLYKFISNDKLFEFKKQQDELYFQARKKKKIKTTKEDGSEEEIEVEQLSSNEENSEFFKRAMNKKDSVDVIDKTSKLRALKQKIESGEMTGSYIDPDDYVEEVSNSELESAFTMPGIKMSPRRSNDYSDDGLGDVDSFDAIPSFMLNQGQSNGRGGTTDKEARDLAALQRQHMKSRRSPKFNQ